MRRQPLIQTQNELAGLQICSSFVHGAAMAWLRRPRTLFDLLSFEANLRISCLDCRHFADFEAKGMIAYFRARCWNNAWELVAGHFKCVRCGSKRISAHPVGRPDPPPRPLSPLCKRPRPIEDGEDPPPLRLVG